MVAKLYRYKYIYFSRVKKNPNVLIYIYNRKLCHICAKYNLLNNIRRRKKSYCYYELVSLHTDENDMWKRETFKQIRLTSLVYCL